MARQVHSFSTAVLVLRNALQPTPNILDIVILASDYPHMRYYYSCMAVLNGNVHLEQWWMIGHTQI